jgi:hypothetical protein
MKQSINEHQFINAFADTGRQDQFSYDGKMALYDYLVELEDDLGEETELDVIALCCEFTEYKTVEEFNDDYGEACETVDDIREYTTVIDVDADYHHDKHTFIIEQY